MVITSYMNSDANPTTSSKFINDVSHATSDRINMEYNTESGYWIYCNNPESLPSDAFGDNNKGNRRLNRVIVPAGTHELFLSYLYNLTDTATFESAKTPFTFGIQIYNRTSSPITFKKEKYGMSKNQYPNVTWQDVPVESVKDYLTSTAQTTVTIPAYGVHWCMQDYITSGSSLISGLMRFTVSGEATVSVYSYQDTITGDETVYPNSTADLVYSGWSGLGSRLNAKQVVLTASDILSRTNRNIFFLTNYKYPCKINNSSKNSDFLPITLAADNAVTINETGNLGNWGAIYKIPIKFINDQNYSVTLQGYIKTDTSKTSLDYPIIYDGVSTVKCGLITNSSNSNGYKNSWNWLTLPVAAKSTVEFTYYYVLGTNSQAGKKHVFKVEY